MDNEKITKTLQQFNISDKDIQTLDSDTMQGIFAYIHYFIFGTMKDLFKPTGYDNYIEEYENNITCRLYLNSVINKITDAALRIKIDSMVKFYDGLFIYFTEPVNNGKFIYGTDSDETHFLNRIPLHIDSGLVNEFSEYKK